MKQEDAEKAEYVDIGDIDPLLLVSRLKRRLLSEKKLDVDPSFVSLRLVRCAGEEPTAEEEAAATVLNPRRTLREAGVADGSSLLACVSMPSSSSPPRLPAEEALRAQEEQLRALQLLYDQRPTLRQLLAQAGIQRPSESVLRTAELRFAPQVNALSDAAGAVALYDFVMALPGTTTKAAFSAKLDIDIKGPLFQERPTCGRGATLVGTHTSGRSVIVKVIYSVNTALASQPLEVRVCTDLQLEPWDGAPHPHFLVRASSAEMDVKPEEARLFKRSGACWAVITPRCIATLAELTHLSDAAVVAGMVRMRTALEFMHSQQLVHCDVKSDNVLVQSDGSWLLFDFGSTTPLELPITSLTEIFHPTLKLGMPATVEVDWQLLFCMLLVEVNKNDWQRVLMMPGISRVNEAAMRAAYAALLARDDTSEAMCSLARDLNARAFRF